MFYPKPPKPIYERDNNMPELHQTRATQNEGSNMSDRERSTGSFAESSTRSGEGSKRGKCIPRGNLLQPRVLPHSMQHLCAPGRQQKEQNGGRLGVKEFGKPSLKEQAGRELLLSTMSDTGNGCGGGGEREIIFIGTPNLCSPHYRLRPTVI